MNCAICKTECNSEHATVPVCLPCSLPIISTKETRVLVPGKSSYEVRVQIHADDPMDAIRKTILPHTEAIEAEVQDLGHQIKFPPKYDLPISQYILDSKKPEEVDEEEDFLL